MNSRRRMTTILFLFSIHLSTCSGCDVNDVAVYKVKLKTFWDEDTFGEDYPFRAQWSQVFGQTHNSTYALFRIGDVARLPVRDFAKLGSIEQLMEEGDEEPKVYDQFVAPSITSGAGETENIVLADNEHSLISLMTRMIPSPDWFIGIDGLDLCIDSTWIDQVTLDLEPIDAGAVEGTTYNQKIAWPSDPVQNVEKVTVRNPESPLANLRNRKLMHSPTVAKIEISKIEEYSSKQINDIARKELIKNLKSDKKHDQITERDNYFKHYDQTILPWEHHPRKELTTKNPFDELKDLEEDVVDSPRPNNPDNYVEVVTKAPEDSDKNFDKEELRNMDDVVLAVATGHKLGLGKHLPRHFKSRLHHAVNKDQHHDCVVSDWSKWSDCTDPCSPSGVMVRSRTIVREKRREGRECPDLIEKKPCGHKCRGDDYGW